VALDFSTLTAEQIAELAKLIQQSNLKAVQDEIDKQQGARLHDEKNAPWAPGGYYAKALKEVPPYKFRPYPKMLYSADYVTAQRDYEVAVRYRERRDEPGLRDEMIRHAEAAMRASCRTVMTEQEERDAVNTGLWMPTPQEAVEVDEARQQAIAQAAAEAAYDDRRLSAAAQAERAAADAVSEGHLVEVPEQRRGPGRPRKE